MARSYPCLVVGLPYEGRLAYIERHVDYGDELTLVPEPDNKHSSEALAVYHGRRKIGYIPTDKSWIKRSVAEGDEHYVVAEDLYYNDDGVATSLNISITIIKDGDGEAPIQPKARPHTVTSPKPSIFARKVFLVIGVGILFLYVIGSLFPPSKKSISGSPPASSQRPVLYGPPAPPAVPLTVSPPVEAAPMLKPLPQNEAVQLQKIPIPRDKKTGKEIK